MNRMLHMFQNKPRIQQIQLHSLQVCTKGPCLSIECPCLVTFCTINTTANYSGNNQIKRGHSNRGRSLMKFPWIYLCRPEAQESTLRLIKCYCLSICLVPGSPSLLYNHQTEAFFRSWANMVDLRHGIGDKKQRVRN